MSSVPPKHLDPAISYASDESLFISQIYDSPLGYHFLKRPYELIPVAMRSLPETEFLDANREPVSVTGEPIAYTRYILTLRDDLHYQPHPSFATDADGAPLYLFKTAAESKAYRGVPDFPESGSRPVNPQDFMYGIKRMADPRNKSPMLSLMGQYIVGMPEFSESVKELPRGEWSNLHDYPMAGLEQLDERRYSITINGLYPQFVYWLAMHFFAPVPWEADRFYHNPGFIDKNLTLDWWPVGSGAYMMVKNDPNSEIVLERNPNYRADFYPTEGEAGDREAGWLDDAGKQVPFIDRAHFRLEKEMLSLWTKFLQGYYDRSGEVHSNTSGFFDQAFVVGPDGLELSAELENHNLTVSPDVKPGMYYWGFNMRDPLVGGYTEEKRKLRLALALAYDTEEYLNIFYKGNAVAAQSIIPPGIPGFIEGETGIDPHIYDWVDGKPQRKTIEYARQLLAEAGYPGGRHATTGEPLRIYIDVQSHAVGNASMDWTRRQFERIGVQVEFRPADWNRTRQKYMTGNTQIFSHGWLADYPDPENFLFLAYGPESPLVCNCDGANNFNYGNDEFDALFQRMRAMEAGPERSVIVAEMVSMLRRDVIWMYAFHPLEYYLNNEWVHNTKRHGITKRTLKYLRIDDELRLSRQAQWNQPVVWPLWIVLGLLVAVMIPAVTAYRRRQRKTIRAGQGS
ncbi:peptide ABC transporter substrate-binding protein [Halieaceae bacterium IMCC14734]|uniref:Peptide ABC transporter substrate-binding protein n=2 Tax=Candidatus Litorirhabdus singularis TaxID=2518993 RepID=A0ABT3TFG7_9GAMM|nr:peptide ABC transporter substrate-binding protein [Candidatus Litorirhabdus singularis]